MEIIFLGTSSGKPTSKRNLSAAAVKSASSKNWCLVDCGEGTQYRIMNSNLSLSKLDLILITHAHGDHVFGLPGLLGTASMDNRQNDLTIAAPKCIVKFIEASLLLTQMHLTYNINFITLEELNNKINFNDIEIEKVKLAHGVDSYGFVFTQQIIKRKLVVEKLKQDKIEQGPLWGRLQNEEDILIEGRTFYSKDYVAKEIINKKIIVAGDNANPNMLDDSIHNTDVLVHEATFTSTADNELIELSGHCTAEWIAKYAEVKKVPNLILTHFSSRYADDKKSLNKNSITEIYEEAKKFYKGNLFLAKDFNRYVLDDEKKVLQT